LSLATGENTPDLTWMALYYTTSLAVAQMCTRRKLRCMGHIATRWFDSLAARLRSMGPAQPRHSPLGGSACCWGRFLCHPTCHKFKIRHWSPSDGQGQKAFSSVFWICLIFDLSFLFWELALAAHTWRLSCAPSPQASVRNTSFEIEFNQMNRKYSIMKKKIK
jgi:hypothetical protein